MPQRLSERLGTGIVFILLVLPWVQPFSSGPSRNAWPWLISAACGAGVLLLRRHLTVRLALGALLTAALLSCFMGVLQYFGQARWLAPWVWPIGPGEAFGNLRQRNQFGSLTAMGLAALLAWLAQAPAAARPAVPASLAWLALLVLTLGNAVSLSRTGFLAWMLVALGFAWFSVRQRRGGMGLAVAALPLGWGAALLLPHLLAAATPSVSGSCELVSCGMVGRFTQAGQYSRVELWDNVITLIALRPWGGWGWGELDYAHFITLFSPPRFSEKLGNAHNLPLHLAVELGLPVALGVCGVLLAMVWRARPWQETEPWRCGVWAVLGVVALHSLLEYPLWYGPFQLTVLLGVVFLWRSRPAASAVWVGRRRARWPDMAAVAALALLAWASVDYLRVSQPFLPPGQRSAWWTGEPLQIAQRSWWFQDEARYAALALTPLGQANASAQHQLAQDMLHHSPEPMVIEKLLDSARLLGLSDQWHFYARRYEAAYPQDHARWQARQPRTAASSGASAR